VLNDVEHGDEVNTTIGAALGKTGDIFGAFAKNAGVALAAQALHHALIQFEAVKA